MHQLFTFIMWGLCYWKKKTKREKGLHYQASLKPSPARYLKGASSLLYTAQCWAGSWKCSPHLILGRQRTFTWWQQGQHWRPQCLASVLPAAHISGHVQRLQAYWSVSWSAHSFLETKHKERRVCAAQELLAGQKAAQGQPSFFPAPAITTAIAVSMQSMCGLQHWKLKLAAG